MYLKKKKKNYEEEYSEEGYSEDVESGDVLADEEGEKDYW